MLAVRSGIEAARSVFGTSLPTDAVGWRRACGCLRTTVLDNFDGNLSMRIEQDRRNEGLGREQIKLGDYASTLLAVVSAPPWLAYIAVGDCFLVVDRRPGGAFLLSPVAEVREHGGATVFMTSDSRQEHCSTGLVWDAGIRGIALATDGLYEALLTYRRDADDVLWYTAPKDFVRYFDHFASAGGDELASVLASDPFVKSSGDDKTMIIMVQE
ncbi:hypothetical protein GCM10010472_71260 [Pseudonocardia halophobica]|uniref:PPM-type phosphatase domain-containing protein n=2 Tax=Pseudonocardia halophobica TaxID=29401 RepID=A0A9W6L149_9PSEU|nr:hypothetical protein GCM10017577_21430 [Pseudonocardia halophobica]